mgnify:FL=1
MHLKTSLADRKGAGRSERNPQVHLKHVPQLLNQKRKAYPPTLLRFPEDRPLSPVYPRRGWGSHVAPDDLPVIKAGWGKPARGGTGSTSAGGQLADVLAPTFSDSSDGRLHIVSVIRLVTQIRHSFVVQV